VPAGDAAKSQSSEYRQQSRTGPALSRWDRSPQQEPARKGATTHGYPGVGETLSPSEFTHLSQALGHTWRVP
jgi:hypothetical protein